MSQQSRSKAFHGQTETHVIVSANVNEMAMEQFAKSYTLYVVVLEPTEPADKMKKWFKKALKIYKNK